MAVPTITFRGGLLEVLLPFALPPASTGAASSAARLLIVAKNVLLFICWSPSLSPLILLSIPANSLPGPDRQQVLRGAEVQPAVGNSRCGQANALKPVRRQHTELLAGRKHEHIALFADEIEFAIRRDRRRGKALPAAANAFLVMKFAGLNIEASHDAVVRAAPEQIADDDGCLEIIPLSRMAPDDGLIGRANVGRRDVARGVETHRAHGTELAVAAGED